MMSVERPFEAWEEVQRHGQDLADKLAQGFTGLIQSTHITPPVFPWPSPPNPKLFDVEFPAPNFAKGFTGLIQSTHITPPVFPWPSPPKPKLFDVEFPAPNFAKKDFGLAVDNSSINGVMGGFDIGNKIGQAGADFGASLNGVVQQFFSRLPVPFRHDENNGVSLRTEVNSQRSDMSTAIAEDLESLAERLRDCGYTDNDLGSEESMEKEIFGVNLKTLKHFGRALGTVNITSTYDSRMRNVETSLLSRGDFLRVEASNERSSSGNENNSLFLVQLGPVLFVRDSTLLLPVHLSKQHLLWYGYDRKNGMHSLCPAVWSKHRRWLLMSMICLNPLACSFMDLQFPNGQITYVSGEGLSTSAFLPLCGGLLQAQGQYPGEMKFSFSCKNKWGSRITSMVQWPDKSFTLGFDQALAWKRSGLMVRPTIQFSLSPTFGGSNPGLRAEFTHSVKEEINLICGCALLRNPSAFASVSLGRSKWNGNVGSAGIVLKLETPLGSVGTPSFSVQLNTGIEF